MTLSQKVADSISEILNKDVALGKSLLALPAEEALAKINALGHSFTLDELKAYGEAARVSPQAQLGDDALENVAGGRNMEFVALPVVTLPGILPIHENLTRPGIQPLPGVIEPMPITALPDIVKW